MNLIYVAIPVSLDMSWEDMVIYLTEPEARTASMEHLDWIVQIFEKTDNGYRPTSNYYKNGLYVQASEYA